MNQPALPLPDMQTPAIRLAYERTPSINTRYSFEQAMACRPLAIALRLYAEAITRERKA